MNTNRAPTVEQVSDHFVGYICEHKASARHVRRVASWIGFVIGGIDKVATGWGFNRERQFWFQVADGTFYKVRYQHTLGSRGGIEILRMNGNADGPTAVELKTLQDAETFYLSPFAAGAQRPARAA